MSEEISALLKKRGIVHKVLNAKFHEQEAEIIADAGVKGAVTIATNMAGSVPMIFKPPNSVTPSPSLISVPRPAIFVAIVTAPFTLWNGCCRNSNE